MNRMVLTAKLHERGALRYTPAGVPALDVLLKHESTVSEDGQPRKVSMEIKAVGLGRITQALATQALGSEACYGGFMAASRNGRGLVFHLTELGSTEPSL